LLGTSVGWPDFIADFILATGVRHRAYVLTHDRQGHWKGGTKIGGGAAVVGGAVGATTGHHRRDHQRQEASRYPDRGGLTFTVQ
jgi:hypothetical protein